MGTSIASRLTELRSEAKLGSSELARLAGLKNASHVGMIERGERTEIAGSTAVELARVLGTTAEWLVAGRGNRPSREQIRAAVRAAQSAALPVGGADRGLAHTGTGG